MNRKPPSPTITIKGRSTEALLRSADLACYSTKQARRNQVVCA
ncbi:hypothetical protein ACEN2T_20315 [Pseudomonas sp. W22_MBD1_FP4]